MKSWAIAAALVTAASAGTCTIEQDSEVIVNFGSTSTKFTQASCDAALTLAAFGLVKVGMANNLTSTCIPGSEPHNLTFTDGACVTGSPATHYHLGAAFATADVDKLPTDPTLLQAAKQLCKDARYAGDEAMKQFLANTGSAHHALAAEKTWRPDRGGGYTGVCSALSTRLATGAINTGGLGVTHSCAPAKMSGVVTLLDMGNLEQLCCEQLTTMYMNGAFYDTATNAAAIKNADARCNVWPSGVGVAMGYPEAAYNCPTVFSTTTLGIAPWLDDTSPVTYDTNMIGSLTQIAGSYGFACGTTGTNPRSTCTNVGISQMRSTYNPTAGSPVLNGLLLSTLDLDGDNKQNNCNRTCTEPNWVYHPSTNPGIAAYSFNLTAIQTKDAYQSSDGSELSYYKLQTQMAFNAGAVVCATGFVSIAGSLATMAGGSGNAHGSDGAAMTSGCSAQGGAYVLSGCVPQVCNKPAGANVGYANVPTKMFAGALADPSAGGVGGTGLVTCATDYSGTVAVNPAGCNVAPTLSGAAVVPTPPATPFGNMGLGVLPVQTTSIVTAGSFSLHGCSENTCVNPTGAPAVGYSNITNAAGSKLATQVHNLAGVVCAANYAGTPSVTKCSANSGAYSLSGCTAWACVDPTTAGFNYAGAAGSKSWHTIQSTLVLACASGYTGAPIVTKCSTNGGAYSVSGCVDENSIATVAATAQFTMDAPSAAAAVASLDTAMGRKALARGMATTLGLTNDKVSVASITAARRRLEEAIDLNDAEAINAEAGELARMLAAVNVDIAYNIIVPQAQATSFASNVTSISASTLKSNIQTAASAIATELTNAGQSADGGLGMLSSNLTSTAAPASAAGSFPALAAAGGSFAAGTTSITTAGGTGTGAVAECLTTGSSSAKVMWCTATQAGYKTYSDGSCSTQSGAGVNNIGTAANGVTVGTCVAPATSSAKTAGATAAVAAVLAAAAFA